MKIKKTTPLQSFTVISLMLLVVSLLITGWWVSSQITSSVIGRVGHTSSQFAGSVIAPEVLDMVAGGRTTDLREVMERTSLGEDIVAFKVWARNGEILYSTRPTEIGKIYPVEAGLSEAWNGVISAEMSNLNRDEHIELRQVADELIETYSPIREPGTGRIVAVVEFYQSVAGIYEELRSARLRSWAIVAAVVIMIYLSLIAVVRRGSRTVVKQRGELERRIAEYENLLNANYELNARVNAAAVRTTALNEKFLRAIAADLHDGPAQEIGFSLLKLDQVGNDSARADARKETKSALERALSGIRDVSAGLRSPELDDLCLREVVERAIRIHASRVQGNPVVHVGESTHDISLVTKITVFRIIQEALRNAHKHAQDDRPEIDVRCSDKQVKLCIQDHGSGMLHNGGAHRGMGLAIMRERAELLGGTCTVESQEGAGTTITATVPFLYEEGDRGE